MGDAFEIRTGMGFVEADATFRLPLEPKGERLSFRVALRKALAELSAADGELLHATYGAPFSADRSFFDVENVLYFNVGAGCMREATRHGLRFELRSAPVSTGTSTYRYSLVPSDTEFLSWQRDGSPVTWKTAGRVSFPRGDKPDGIWHWIKSGEIQAPKDSNLQPEHPFGMSILLRGPRPPSLSSKIKSLFDGAISAFHVHDGTSLEGIATQVASRIGVERGAAESLLMDPSKSVLGERSLLRRGSGAWAWNPADDWCVAGELRFERANEWELTGSLFGVKPR